MKNCYNSLDFEDTGQEILYAGTILIVEQIMFYNLGSLTNFRNFDFFNIYLRGGWGKKIDLFSSKFLFLIYKKSQGLSNQYINAFCSNRQYLKHLKVV